MYTYGENVQYPLATTLTADKKYFNDPEGLAQGDAHEIYLRLLSSSNSATAGQFGYFRHKENVIPPWEYKMNNTFVVLLDGEWQAAG